MIFNEVLDPVEHRSGQDSPSLKTKPPGPQSRTWLTRLAAAQAPMGPRRDADPARGLGADVSGDTVVYATAKGSNVVDVDGNRYVDLAAGFGAMLLGHAHPTLSRIIELQAERLLLALGDVHPADAKVGLLERLARLYPGGGGRVILGQSGADAITAALKTAQLATGRPGVVAFHGAYHGLSYAPLASCALRASYREPFARQLNQHARFIDYPVDTLGLERTMSALDVELRKGDVGAVLVEPVLGRAGCIVPPRDFLSELMRRTHAAGALVVADEIWTGLGRAGAWLYSERVAARADLICLGKGLGGGLPVSACLGSSELMRSWSREQEVVHTSTFAGAPLGCATAIACLDVLSREKLVERARELGARFLKVLTDVVGDRAKVRGVGMMWALEMPPSAGGALAVQRRLLERGYITTTGGGAREVVILTPALNINEALLMEFSRSLAEVL